MMGGARSSARSMVSARRGVAGVDGVPATIRSPVISGAGAAAGVVAGAVGPTAISIWDWRGNRR